MSEENKEQTFVDGKYKSAAELEKAYVALQAKMSAGEHKKSEPAPAKQPDVAKLVATAVKEAIDQQKTATAQANAAAAKEFIKKTPDAALAIKKVLHTEDGKKEAAFIERVEKGDVSKTELELLVEQGRDLDEPPNFLDSALQKGKNSESRQFESDEEEYFKLLDDPALQDDRDGKNKPLVKRMHELQEKLGLEREDFSTMDQWDTGVHAELAGGADITR